MKIAIDGVRLTKRPTGVTDITISIINSISQNFPDYKLYILTYDSLHPEIASQIILSPNVELVICRTTILSKIGLYWSLFKINSVLKSISVDFFIEPNFIITPYGFPKEVKLISFVHDVVFKRFPQTMNLITKLQFWLFFNSTIKRSDVIWANSIYTKKELVYFFSNQLIGKPIFVGSGVNQVFLREVSGSADKGYQDLSYCGRKYLLFVGTLEPRKNIPFLLDLFYALRSSEYHLVIVGGKGWGDLNGLFANITGKEGFPLNRVHFTGYITSDQLIFTYKNAFAFLSTSLNEGLGLPQLEAMACGCPVITPHNSAMIEVVDGAGITVDSWEIDQWMDAIKKIEIKRHEYVNRGYERASSYNWDHIISTFNQEVLCQKRNCE